MIRKTPIERMRAIAERSIPAGIERFPADDRATWLARREKDVTASAIAALLPDPTRPGEPNTSAHPYITRRGLYAQKTGELADQEIEVHIEENSVSLPPLIRGTVLEPVIPSVMRYLRPTWTVEPAGFYYRDAAARIGATPDFFVIDPARRGLGSLQTKTTDAGTLKTKWTVDGVVEPPLFVAIQAIVEAVLTGATWCAVAVLVSGSTLDLHLIDIQIHAGVMARLRTEVARFWQLVAAGTPPEVDYTRDGELMGDIYREDNAQEIDLRAVNHLPEMLSRRDDLKAEIKRAGDEVEVIDAEFKARIGRFETALIAGGRRATWRVEPRRARYIDASEPRVLRFSRS